MILKHISLEVAINIVKYILIGLGLVTTILSLGNDYKDKISNKFNRRGKVFLTWAIISFLVSFYLQSLEIKFNQENQYNNIQDQLRQNNKIITAIEKTLNPIKDMTFEATIIVSDTSNLLLPYFNRLKNSKIIEPRDGIFYNNQLFPSQTKQSDKLTFKLIKNLNFSIEFFKNYPQYDKEVQALQFENSDYLFDVNTLEQMKIRNDSSSYLSHMQDDNYNQLIINISKEIKRVEKTGEIQSLYDLENAYIVITVVDDLFNGTDNDKNYYKEKSLLERVIIDKCVLVIDGKELFIDTSKLVKFDGPGVLSYRYRFPNNLKVIPMHRYDID